jgi:hypothetical protein
MEKQMQKAVVFHADILGFKAIIQKSEDDKAEETLNKIKGALEEATRLVGDFNPLAEAASKTKFKYKLFSDNLYASFSYEPNDDVSFGQAFVFSALFARSYFSVMLDNQFPIRGAISFGSDYSDNNMIFSLALAKAYLLESDKAKFPRVIIDQELFNEVRNGLTVGGSLMLDFLNDSFLQDDKCMYFLNPSGTAKVFGLTEPGFTSEQLYKGFLKRDIDFAKANYEQMKKEGKEDVAEKYKWLHAILLWYYFDKKEPCRYKFTETSFGKVAQ